MASNNGAMMRLYLKIILMKDENKLFLPILLVVMTSSL